jgi:hypothetical protein
MKIFLLFCARPSIIRLFWKEIFIHRIGCLAAPPFINLHKVEIGNVRNTLDSVIMLSCKTELFTMLKKSLSIKSETSGSSLPE